MHQMTLMMSLAVFFDIETATTRIHALQAILDENTLENSRLKRDVVKLEVNTSKCKYLERLLSLAEDAKFCC